jgi:predicted TIM-barrel fold metal-dependent hydrolase
MTNYLQAHCALPQFYQSHLISLVLEGTFERFPRLRFAFVEGGFGWLPHVVWRMDKEYKALRQQAPLLKRLPSHYVGEHVRVASQPVEEPLGGARQLAQLLDMMGGPEMLLYASDFPHFDFDPPSVLPKSLGEEARRKILHDNAAEWFGLPAAAASEVREAA